MPLPKPNKDESKEKFMDRCMANETMNEEYPDKDQRYAVCQTQWKDKDKKTEPADLERRILNPDDVELRISSEDGKPAHLVGYAARFNRDSEDLGGFIERIKPGAFTEALKGADIRALKNHDANLLLGRTTANTLGLAENSRGLKFDITMPDTTAGRDTAKEVERGDISGCSFSFQVKDEEWDEKDGQLYRTIHSVARIGDVGPVTFPAYPDTSVAVRSLDAWKEQRAQKPESETPHLDEAKQQIAGIRDAHKQTTKHGLDQRIARADQ